MTAPRFQSYVGQTIDPEKIPSLALQYRKIDMAELLGADEKHFPFLIQTSPNECQLMWWNPQRGASPMNLEDQVLAYATARYLREHAYPVFPDSAAAQQWARTHDWPKDGRRNPDL